MKGMVATLLCFMSLLLSPLLQACSSGFTFFFDPWPADATEYTDGEPDVTAFLDQQFGAGRWVEAGDDFFLRVQSGGYRVTAPATVPVSVGSRDPSQAGRFRGITLYAVNQRRVFDADRYSREYLPGVYHITEPGKNSPKAFSLDDISHDVSVIRKHTHYTLSSRALPLVDIRANFESNSKLRLFAALQPSDPTEPVVIVRQPMSINTNALCSWRYYVRGAWPEGLKRRVDYE